MRRLRSEYADSNDGTESDFLSCVPSVGMQLGTRPDNAFTQSQTFLVVSGLAQGWYVAMPDDGGPTGIFGMYYLTRVKIF